MRPHLTGRACLALLAAALLSLGFKACESDGDRASNRNQPPRRDESAPNVNANSKGASNENAPMGVGARPDEGPAARPDCGTLSTAGAFVGVTITNTDLASLEAAKIRVGELARHSAAPVVTRIVFDPVKRRSGGDDPNFDQQLRDYKRYAEGIRQVSCVMGEIGDSHGLYGFLSTGGGTKVGRPPFGLSYAEWTERLTTALDPSVDVWEVGNELNGGWTGWKCNESGTRCSFKGKSSGERLDKQREVLKATRDAYETIRRLKAQHKIRPDALTALTLYYNQEEENEEHQCAEYDEARMKPWLGQAAGILGDEMRNDLDLVLLSFYESDCPDVEPTAENFSKSLAGSVRTAFGGAHTAFGLGEVGYKGNGCPGEDEERVGKESKGNEACLKGNSKYITLYYTKLDRCIRTLLSQPVPGRPAVRYVGGYFYWWYLQDMVLPTSPSANFGRDALASAARTFGGTGCDEGAGRPRP
jgi:hypothetical protein